MILLAACIENQVVGKDPASDAGLEDEGAPDIRVDPAAVDFGTVAWGDSASADLTVSNVGGASLALHGLYLRDGSAELAWSALASPLLEPGASVATVLTWTPSGTSPVDNVLHVDSDDPDTPRVAVPLVGEVPAGAILVEPTTWDFGALTVGESATAELTVSNAGAGWLTVSGLSYTANDADLRVLDPGALSSLPASFRPGASTTIVVEYAPSAAGADEGAVSLESDDPASPVAGASQSGSAQEGACPGFAWTDWTTLTEGIPGSGSGTIDSGSCVVEVSYDGEVRSQSQASGGTNYWLPEETWTSADVPSAPPAADVVCLYGGSSTVNTLSFSPPAIDPVLAVISLGTSGAEVRYEFDAPFTVLSSGSSTSWGGGTLYECGSQVLCGREGNGTVQFTGTYSSIQWTVATEEGWHGFTVGAGG